MLKFKRLFKQLSFLFIFIFSVLIVNDLNAATFNFNTLYKGTGTSYDQNTQSITGLSAITGTSFKFYQAGAQFSGNSVNGTLSYYDASNTLVSINGQLNRQDKSGNTSQSFYFVPFVTGGTSSFNGESYLLIVPGYESVYSVGASVSTSSDPMDNALNAVVNSLPTIITGSSLTGFTACAGTSAAAQTFTVTATSLTAGVTVTAPTSFAVSATQNGTYTTSIVLPQTGGTITNANVWVKLTSTSAGAYSGTISLASTGAGTQTVPVTGTITAGSLGGTISGTTVVTSGTNTNTLTLVGYSGTIQWQSSTNNITYSDIVGATSATYTATNVTATTYYRAVVTNGSGSCSVAYSNIATITFDNGCYAFGETDFKFNGNATIISSDEVRLTLEQGNQNGSIWNRNKVNLDYDFDISSSIYLGNRDNGADGIAFVLQNLAVNAGSAGGGLGYSGIIPSFAVEFDTYYNGGEPVSDHIAIIKNGLTAGAHNDYTIPYEVEMEDGQWHDVRFVWIAATKNFKVYWEGNQTPIFNITNDLKANIFNNSSNVYFGFTGATGGMNNLQKVKINSYCLVKEIAITPKPGYLNDAAATSFCDPATVVLEASTSTSYLWYKDGIAMPDSTSQSIVVSTPGVYKVQGVDANGISSTSSEITVSVGATLLPGTISGNGAAVCSGSNSTLLTLTGSTGNIQWKSSTNGTSFTAIIGATSDTYTATNLNASTYYKATVSNTNATCSADAGTISITVSPVSVAGTISGGNITYCTGASNSTTLQLSGYTGTIQWQSSSDNVTFTNITGETSATYTATDVTSTTYYRVVVTSGVCSAANSSAVAITISQCIVANPDINATNVNTPVSGNVSTNDIITAGSTYGTPTASSNNPTGATLTLNTDGTYTFNTTTPGKYIYYIPVCGAGQTTGCAVTTLEITVINPKITSNPPLAKNDYSTTSINTAVVVNILSNDKPGNVGTSLVPSTVTVIDAPLNGTVSVNSTTGNITFTPTNGFTGTDSLNYRVCDNSSPAYCQIATVYFKISSSAIAEYTTADEDFNTVAMKTSAQGNVLTNDVNSAGNALTVTSYSTPLSSQGTIVINANGSYTFTPTTTFYGPLDITYTVCTSGSVCATATLHILVVPLVPAPPKPIHGIYTTGVSSNPTTIASTITEIPAGCKVIYCDVDGTNCSTTAPALPTVPGIYVWCIKSLDTVTNFTSDPCVYDTLRILPVVKTVNATYVKGVSTNPANISTLVTSISTGSNPKWCDVNGNNCSTTAPLLPTNAGTFIWCVKAVDIASGLTSANCVMDTVTILDPYTVMEISKTARAVKLNPDGTVLITFAMSASNKTDAAITNVSIVDDLFKTFNTTTGITVYSLETYGGLVKNTAYNGISNIDLVTSSSRIEPKKTDSLVLKVLVSAANLSGRFLNTAVLSGTTKYGNVSVSSNDPSINANDTTLRTPTPFIIPQTDIIIAGGFSPNQDGINDRWIIVRPFGTTIEVKVFNRWGNIVYQNGNYMNEWDGRGQQNFAGDYVPEGTYFYLVSAIKPDGTKQNFNGSLTIVR